MRVAGQFWLTIAVVLVVADAGVSTQAIRESHPSLMDTSLFRAIARQQNPAVVAITTTTRFEAAAPEDAEWFERFLNPARRGPQTRREVGSGFLISPTGDILTNDHVVADADLIEVRLLGREATTYQATVVGRDPTSDSAVIRLTNPPRDLPVATLGDSSALETGDWVMAIGNPYQLGHSVTVGVVSYQARSFEIAEHRWLTLIQTDASINPGSSGGPLLNVRGEVIGINVAVLADGFGDSSGIGFAVPINSVKDVLAQLRDGDVVRGHLGVRLRRTILTDNDATALGLAHAAGALIMSVDARSSAQGAGLRAGDVVVDFSGAPIANADDLMSRVAIARPGTLARVTVVRGRVTLVMQVEVERLTPPTTTRARLGLDVSTDFGLVLEDFAPSRRHESGAVVQSVRDDSPAANAGLEKGDIVRKINQQAVRSAAEAMHELDRVRAGSRAFLLISRAGEGRLIEMLTE
jgi:serine protease Do